MKNEKHSPSTTQRMLVEQKSKQSIVLSTPSFLSLARKAGKNDIPLTVLEQVYARGLLAAKYHPKNTLEQQAFHRVDSFIHEGKAYELDKDLLETPKVPDGSKHMDIIKNAIKNHKDRNKPQNLKEGFVGDVLRHGVGYVAGRAITNKWRTGSWSGRMSVERRAKLLNQRRAEQEQVKSRAAELRGEPTTTSRQPTRRPASGEASQETKSAFRKKELVRRSFESGRKVGGEAAELKKRLVQARTSQGTRERQAGVEYAAKKVGISTVQAQRSIGIPVEPHKRGPSLSPEQRKGTQQAWDEYWNKRRPPKGNIG